MSDFSPRRISLCWIVLRRADRGGAGRLVGALELAFGDDFVAFGGVQCARGECSAMGIIECWRHRSRV